MSVEFLRDPTQHADIPDGVLAEVQCYSPYLEEDGSKRPYGPRAKRLVKKVWRTDAGVAHKFWLATPERPNDESGYTYPGDDTDLWVIEPEELGVLF